MNSVIHLVVESPWNMTQEPSIFHRYGLGADVSGTDPLGVLELHLDPKPFQRTPCSTSAPTLPPHLYNNQPQVTIVEVKDLRQIAAIESGSGIQMLGGNG
jgi:hypothetical protein